jgi:hypothetical protein
MLSGKHIGIAAWMRKVVKTGEFQTDTLPKAVLADEDEEITD